MHLVLFPVLSLTLVPNNLLEAQIISLKIFSINYFQRFLFNCVLNLRYRQSIIRKFFAFSAGMPNTGFIRSFRIYKLSPVIYIILFENYVSA